MKPVARMTPEPKNLYGEKISFVTAGRRRIYTVGGSGV